MQCSARMPQRRFALVALVALGAGAGCAGAADPAAHSAALDGAYPTSFDIDNLLTDDDVRGGAGISVDEVQAFLTAKGSYLAGYTDPAFVRSAASAHLCLWPRLRDLRALRVEQ